MTKTKVSARKVHYVSSWSDQTIYEKVKEQDVHPGDFIEYMADNQQDYARYKVVMEHGEKGLRHVGSIDESYGKRHYAFGKNKRKKHTTRKKKKSGKRKSIIKRRKTQRKKT